MCRPAIPIRSIRCSTSPASSRSTKDSCRTSTRSSRTPINSFNLNASYYRAIFEQPDPPAALALQPLEVSFTGNALFALGRIISFRVGFPQGRNVTQYGFVDDLSHTMGAHTIKVGANLSRFDITTYGPGIGIIASDL